MRALAGILAFNGLLVVLGLGVLGVAGVLRLRVGSLIAAVPAALLAGAAVVAVIGTVFLVSGSTLELPVITAAIVVLAVALWALTLLRRRRSPDSDDVEPASRMDRYAGWLVVAVVVVFVLAQAYQSRNLRAAWDAEHNWTLKAVALTTGGLDGDLFTGRVPFSAAHLDYPIGQPVLGALLFRFAGKAENGLLVFELWLLAGAFVLAAPLLSGPRARPWLTMLPPAVALAALTSWGVLRSEADVTLAIFLGAGALALARWIDAGPPGHAIVATVLLGGALNIKNEGLPYTLAIVIAAAAVLALTARRRLLPFVGVCAGLAAFAAPWRLWIAANGPFNRDVTPLSTSLDASFLSARLHRLDFAAQTVLGRFANIPFHAWIMPAFVAVAVALLVTGPQRRLAAFYLGSVVLAVLALLWVYWTTPQPDWAAHIQRTSMRTIAGPLFIAAVGLAHLLPRTVWAASAVDGSQRASDDGGRGEVSSGGEGAIARGGVAP